MDIETPGIMSARETTSVEALIKTAQSTKWWWRHGEALLQLLWTNEATLILGSAAFTDTFADAI